ncbi:MAG: transposase, partial [Acetobacteraceae bacterium]|nr:transposase [Acetobacteraceae bacterium]
WRTSRMPGDEFMRRFLQHVLPKGLHKVRYFGLWHPSRREQAARVRQFLLLDRPPATDRVKSRNDADGPTAGRPRPGEPRACPQCETGRLLRARRLAPKWAQAP